MMAVLTHEFRLSASVSVRVSLGDRNHRLALQVLGELNSGFPHCCEKELLLRSEEVRLQGWGS